MATWN
jgi:hypothetical protein